MCLGIPRSDSKEFSDVARAPGRGSTFRRHRGSSISACWRTEELRAGRLGAHPCRGSPCRRSTRRRQPCALASLQLMGQAYDDELEALLVVEAGQR